MFAAYKHLGPEALAKAQEAFDLGWAEIAVSGDYDPDVARRLLAEKIMECVLKNGERDPRRMKAYALVRMV